MDYVNSAKEKMKNRKLLVTAMLRFANPTVAEIMIKCGIDSVCIDNEHYPFTDNDVVNIVRAVHGAGGKCTMRHVPKSHGALYRLMDMGIDGVLLPNVETPEEAKMLVDAVMYPPEGSRGCCPITRGADFGMGIDVHEYYSKKNDTVTVEVMIESRTGLSNLDEIMKVPGIDMIVIGPSDFSGSYGRPGHASDPDIKSDIDNAISRIKAAGFPVEVMAYDIDFALKKIEEGERVISSRSDLQMLTKTFEDRISAVKKICGECDGSDPIERLRAKKPVTMPYLRIAEPAIAEIAVMAGCDFVVIDDEHFAFSDRDLIDMIRAVHCRGGKAIVRVHDKSRGAIGRILDMGADGIIAPQISSYEEALEVVKATKYPPVGNRGFCPITPGAGYGIGMTPKEYGEKKNSEIVVGLMIETKGAIENLDKILSIKELDYASIGPSDVSASYGYPGDYDNPIVKEAIETARKKIVASHVALSGQCYTDEAIGKAISSGRTVLNLGSDVQFLIWGFTEYVKAVKGSVNE